MAQYEGHNYKILSLCGMACVQKSSTAASLADEYQIVFNDFFENSSLCPLFKEKHTDRLAQVFYSEFVGNRLQGLSSNTPILQDRCILSDAFYEAIYMQMRSGNGIQALNEKLRNDLIKERISTYNILFVIAPPSCHFKILQKMKDRKNSIDTLTMDYVVAQWEIFSHLKTYKIPNFHFIDLKSSEIYTEKAPESIRKKIKDIFNCME